MSNERRLTSARISQNDRVVHAILAQQLGRLNI